MEVKDSMMGCEERTKHNECLGDSKERAECWKSCRVFIPDDEYKPGEERRQFWCRYNARRTSLLPSTFG
eukprot:scaffold114_cov200-Alexandrium_tamarense.AAC.69